MRDRTFEDFFVNSDITWWILGAVAGFAIVYGIHFWLDRRAFYRRNEAGIETFSGYRSAALTGLWEGVVKLVGVLVFFFAGACTLVIVFRLVL